MPIERYLGARITGCSFIIIYCGKKLSGLDHLVWEKDAAIEAVCEITADDIRGTFDASPQTAAETILRIGYKIHSDRLEGCQKHIIT